MTKEPEHIESIVRRLLDDYRTPDGGVDEPATEVCPKCHGRGFLYLPDQGWARTPCHCQDAAGLLRLERAWLRCGFESRFLGCRLETHPLALEGANPGLIAELLNPTTVRREGADDLAGHRRSWVLFGSVGHGKTGLAAGYAHRLLFTTGESVFARTVPDLLDELKASYGDDAAVSEAALLTRYTECGLLVLDDLGAEQIKVRDDGSSWALDRLFTIISRRHAKELPIFVTSNLNPEELLDRMGGVMGQRIMWRILESCGGRDHIRPVEHRNLRMR